MAKAKKPTLTEQVAIKQKKIDELQARLDALGARAYPITAVKKLLEKAKARSVSIEEECREKVKLAIKSFPKDSKELAEKVVELEETLRVELKKIEEQFEDKLKENYKTYSELHDQIKEADSHYADAKLQLTISSGLRSNEIEQLLQEVLGPSMGILDIDSKVDEKDWCDVN